MMKTLSTGGNQLPKNLKTQKSERKRQKKIKLLDLYSGAHFSFFWGLLNNLCATSFNIKDNINCLILTTPGDLINMTGCFLLIQDSSCCNSHSRKFQGCFYTTFPMSKQKQGIARCWLCLTFYCKCTQY